MLLSFLSFGFGEPDGDLDGDWEAFESLDGERESADLDGDGDGDFESLEADLESADYGDADREADLFSAAFISLYLFSSWLSSF